MELQIEYPLGTLLLIRGVSGSGKTTLAKKLADAATKQGRSVRLCEADNFHTRGTEYVFQAARQGQAHLTCQLDAYDSCRTNKDLVIVSNTTTTRKEIEPYEVIAERCCYELHAILLHPTHIPRIGLFHERNTHGVPQEVIARQVGNLTTEQLLHDSPFVSQIICREDVEEVRLEFQRD